jgi:hypothetical protein
MGEQTDKEYAERVRELFEQEDAYARERLSEGLTNDPVDTIYEMVTAPDNVSKSMRTVAYDEQGLQHFIDPRWDSLHLGIRTSDVGADGTANMVLFQAWTKEVKRDPPTMKPTKTYYEDQTHVTWARIFVEADRDFDTGEGLREHVQSQMAYCEELDDDRYFELRPRLVGRTVDDGPWGDDITKDWIKDKINGMGDL